MINFKFNFDEKSFARSIGAQLKDKMIEAKCPGCQRAFRIKLDDIANQRTMTCPGCMKPVQLKDDRGQVKDLIQGRW